MSIHQNFAALEQFILLVEDVEKQMAKRIGNLSGPMGEMYLAVALAEEAGEVAGQLKRFVRDDDMVFTPERRLKIEGELGDVLWYLVAWCHRLGIDFNRLAELNQAKLSERRRHGFKG